MANLFDLVAKLTLDSSEYESGLDKAEGKASKAGGAFKKGLGAAAKVGVAAVGAAAAGIGAIVKQSVDSFGEYEQLVGGAQKIFDEVDYSKIAADAANAYKDLNMSSSQYLESINLAGATFAQTMGDEKGYDTARQGMLAIADYASGTGKNIDELNEKYQMITRSTSSYQSIADQFAGILPATSADFLKQAQAAGFLSDKYKKLTEVPVAEYQQAVTSMLEKGVDGLGLAGNTAKEATETLSGSFAMTKSAWQNLVTGIADPNADIGQLVTNLTSSAGSALENLLPVIEQAISGIGDAVAQMGPSLGTTLSNLITTVLPQIVQGAVSLVQSLAGALISNGPMLVNSAIQIVQILLQAVVTSAPTMLGGAMQLLTELYNGIIQSIPLVLAAIPSLVQGIVDTITTNGPALLVSGVQLLGQLALGVIEAIPMLVEAIPELVTAIVEAFKAAGPQLLETGKELAKNAWQGIKNIFMGDEKADASESVDFSGIDTKAQAASSSMANISSTASQTARSITSSFASIGTSTDFSALGTSAQTAFSGMSASATDTASSITAAFSNMQSLTSASFGATSAEAQEGLSSAAALDEKFGRVAETASSTAQAAQTASQSINTSFSTLGTDISTALSSASTGANFTAVTANAQQAAQQTIAAFSTVPEGLGDNWEATQSIYKDAPSFFQKTFDAAKESVLSVWGTLPDEFKAVWEQIKNVYKEAPTWFQTTFTTVRDNVTQIMGQIATDATTWGEDMMENFNTGIQNRQGALNETLNNVAQDVNDTVGFSEPKKGPLSDFHTYAPDMMNLFMQGIRENTPALRKTVEKSFDFRESFKAPEATISSSRTADTSNAKMDAVLAILQQYLPELVNRDIVLDSGVTVGALLPQIDSGLGQSYSYKARGNA